MNIRIANSVFIDRVTHFNYIYKIRKAAAMDTETITETIIPLAAVIVSILTLPVNYFVARSQVNLALNKHELNSKNRTRKIVANRLKDLLDLLFKTTLDLAKIDLREKYDVAAFMKCMPAIDLIMRDSGAIDRLAKVIDEYIATGETDEREKDEPMLANVGQKLQAIRRIISWGYSSTVTKTEEYIVTGEPDDQLESDIGERLDRKTISRKSTVPPPGYYVTGEILEVCKGKKLSKELEAIKDLPLPGFWRSLWPF